MRSQRMTTAVMTERSMAAPGLEMPGTPGMMGAPTGAPAGMNMVMVPRCTMSFERCKGGMTITCKCDDKTTAAMLQNLCAMMAGGMLGCCAMMNGMAVCTCNLMMAMCK